VAITAGALRSESAASLLDNEQTGNDRIRGNVIECAENRSTSVLDVGECLQREIPGSMAGECKPFL
jgi:hypothetical protein